MDFESYKYIAELLNKIPPKQETPEGQKFHIGEIVRMSNPQNWYNIENKDKLYQVEHSYAQKYGGRSERDKQIYSLIHLWEKNSSAWHDESELTLVKGIDEINEERDQSEFKRLQQKYDPPQQRFEKAEKFIETVEQLYCDGPAYSDSRYYYKDVIEAIKIASGVKCYKFG